MTMMMISPVFRYPDVVGEVLGQSLGVLVLGVFVAAVVVVVELDDRHGRARTAPHHHALRLHLQGHVLHVQTHMVTGQKNLPAPLYTPSAPQRSRAVRANTHGHWSKEPPLPLPELSCTPSAPPRSRAARANTHCHWSKLDARDKHTWLVSWLVGILSQVNRKRLHNG